MLEDMAVVLASCNDGAEHGGERVARYVEPVSPGAVLAALVDQSLADVEPHSSNCHRVDLLLCQAIATSCSSSMRTAGDMFHDVTAARNSRSRPEPVA